MRGRRLGPSGRETCCRCSLVPGRLPPPSARQCKLMLHRRLVSTTLWPKRRGHRRGHALQSTAGWPGSGRARFVARELLTAPGPWSSPASRAKQPAGCPSRGCTISRSKLVLSGAAAAGCRPRHSMQGRPVGRGAPCPGCSGTGRLGPKGRLACGFSSAASAATAGGARHRPRPKLRQLPRQSTRSLARRRPLLLQCPLLACSLFASRWARRRCQQKSQR